MALIMKILFIIAITMAVSVTITMKSVMPVENKNQVALDHVEDVSMLEGDKKIMLPSKRVSRFLAAADNPRAADHCRKDNEICYVLEGINYKCCNNKCFDLSTDNKNCGACKNKCKYRQTCCRGQCVDLLYDKRHCGKCNNRCPKGDYCFYGMCNYG